MFLVIVITIIVTGAVIVGALYSAIVPFFAILWNTANYNIAYYGAIGSTERALLSLRYHEAWYEWGAWFSWGQALSWTMTDIISTGFSNISRWGNGMRWLITSRAVGSIPIASGGDVERLLQGTWSKEFNMLGYDGLIEIPLYLDTSTSVSERYSAGNITNLTASNGIYVQWTLRLPPKILWLFWGGGLYKLDTSSDLDNDNINDDIMVNRGLRGTNMAYNQGISIIPTIRVDYNQQVPIYDFENAIRESQINDASNANGANNVNFYMWEPGGDYEYNVIVQPTVSASLMTGHNAIPINPSVIDPNEWFSSLLNNPDFEQLVLSFNLVNKLSSTINQVFPFIEYQLKICEVGVGCNVPASNRYFSIDASSKVWEYNVHIRLNKPVLKKDSTSEFAIIF